MKDVPAFKWPMPLADLAHPEHWPLRGRNDHSEGMPPEALLTPAADDPPAQEEVAPDDVPREGDDGGPVEPA